MELLANKYTQGEPYQLAQEITNIRKLFGVHFFPLSSIYLSILLLKLDVLSRCGPVAGVTHGSRNAVETILFQHFLHKLVFGTDISSSADFFAPLLRHDMNNPFPSALGGGSLGFVYSNSWDHTNNPQLMLANWISSLNPDLGCMILEKQASSGSRVSISDPFAANDQELIDLVAYVSEQSKLSCSYIGSLELRYVPSVIISDCNHPLSSGTATPLHELTPGKMFLTDYSSPPQHRPLRHHIFLRSSSSELIANSKAIVHSLNNALNVDDPDLLACIFRLHPVTLSPINFQAEISSKIISQVLLSQALKEKIFLDTRGDMPGEGDRLADEIEKRLA